MSDLSFGFKGEMTDADCENLVRKISESARISFFGFSDLA